MGFFTNVWNNLKDVTNGTRTAASLFNGGVDPAPPGGPMSVDVPGAPLGSGPNNIYGYPSNYGGASQTQIVAPGANSNPSNGILTSSGIKSFGPTGIGSSPLPASPQTFVGGQQVSFFKPGPGDPGYNPNAPQTVYDSTGKPLDYNSYIAAGGKSDFSNVTNGGIPSFGGTVGGSSGMSVGTGQVTTASSGTPFSAPDVNNTTDSSNLSGDGSNLASATNGNTSLSDSIFSNLAGYLGQINSAYGNLQDASTISPEEKAQQAKVASDQAAMTSLGYQAQGLYNPDNQTIALPFLTGQAQNKMVGAGIATQLDQSVLNYMQGNRQFAFNSASTLFDASRNNLSTIMDLYSKAAPQNIATNYNPSTGELNFQMRNPFTGAVYNVNGGNIGAQKTFTSIQPYTDPYTGAAGYMATTADGRVVTGYVGGGAASGLSGGVSNPLGGSQGGSSSYAPGPSGTALPTVGSLLSNWTSGGQTMPGSGYQGAVYNTFKQLTGQDINANTPTSTLISNIPALTKGIAAGENVSASLVAATNNPTAILWNNQPNAQPYKASNGYTYAKFNTMQDGWNAANDLVAKKLGAVPTPTTSSMMNAVQQLPPALQQAVKQLPDGTMFFDGSQLTASQIPMAQAFAAASGIKYVEATDASKLNDIAVVKQNLADLSTFVDQNFAGGVWGKIANPLGFNVGQVFGSTQKTHLDAYRTAAINTIQGLAGGQGSGLRLTQGEINTAIDNLPTDTDNAQQAQTKLAVLNAQLDKWVNQIIPGYSSKNAQAGSSTGTSTGTSGTTSSGLSYQVIQ